MSEQFNRTASSVGHDNAFTNNTFSLKETQNAIRNAVDTSFNYLKQLQRDYMSVARFNKTEEDLYLDYYIKLCLIVDKDIIEPTRRRAYRDSEFYNQIISLDDMMNRPTIFTYIPMVMIDHELILDYQIKSNLDGNTEFIFNHIGMPLTYLKSPHTVEVVFLRNALYQSVTTNMIRLQNYVWNIPSDVHNFTHDENHLYFLSVKDSESKTSSNLFPVKFNEDGSLPIDQADPNLYDIIINARDIVFTLIEMENLYEVGYKPIKKRVDNGRLSTAIVLGPEEDKTFTMPVDPHNLLIFKRDKATGLLTYENNKDVILHYPNIYEIMSDELSQEDNDYLIYYFYREISEYPAFKNQFDYIHKYFKKRTGGTLEESVNTILYDGFNDEELTNYFLSIFDYEDADYLYNHGDFFGTLSPYDFDYKIDKLKSMIKQNPEILRDYGEKVSTAFDRYYLNVKGINLMKRIRTSTELELDNPSQYIKFDEPCYMFTFRNETNDYLDLRIFIDGILCINMYQLHVKDTEYFYIPISQITSDSYIEVEDFHSYYWMKRAIFRDGTTAVDLEFPESAPFNIQPTLYDLFVTLEDRTRINRNIFKIYYQLDLESYEISDILEDTSEGEGIPSLLLNDNYMIDADTGIVYVTLDDEFISEEEIELDDQYGHPESTIFQRLPIKHVLLNKIRVYCNVPEYYNVPLMFMVNKTAYISHKTMKTDGLINVRLFNGKLAWAEHPSFVRTFINGRFTPVEFDLTVDDTKASVFMSRSFMKAGDVVTVDISPYSYELEYSLNEIPLDFIVAFEGKLTKPFSFNYYDIYLNGRKLTEKNIEILTANRIKIFNVKSRKNLYIYKRDRDVEYYGLDTAVYMPLDDLLNSNLLPDQDKEEIVDMIVHENKTDITVIPGTNTEPDVDVEHGTSISPEGFNLYKFYIDVILAKGVIQANNAYISRETMESKYPNILERFGVDDRVVLQANEKFYAESVILIGRNEY